MISVIVPIYKTEKYLDKCIKSILEQTYVDIEVILVDDGSPDLCSEICDKWASKDNRVKVIHKRNEGLSAARNSGLKLVSGDYITFIDSDDYIEPDMCEKLYNAALKEKADIACCKYTDVNYNGEEIIKTSHLYNYSDAYSVITFTQFLESIFNRNNTIFACMKLYKTKFIKGFVFRSDVLAEDCAFWISMYQRKGKVVLIEEKLYNYTFREDSISNTNSYQLACDVIIQIRNFELKHGKLESLAYKKYQLNCIREILMFMPYSFIKEKNFCYITALNELKKSKFILFKLKINIIYKIWLLVFLICKRPLKKFTDLMFNIVTKIKK